MRNMDIDSGCSGIRMRDRDIVLYSNLKESADPRNCLMFRGAALFFCRQEMGSISLRSILLCRIRITAAISTASAEITCAAGIRP